MVIFSHIKKVFKDIRKSYRHIPYTWKHYLAFMKVQKQLTGKYNIIVHDWDKLLMYLFLPFLGTKTISNIHNRFSKHHPVYYKGRIKHCKRKEEINWIETIIDWECARFTKPDKPLNARETLSKFYPMYDCTYVQLQFLRLDL